MFDPSKSTHFKVLSGATWNITYGDGSGASGTVGTDVVTVGGISVSGQAVEIATKVSSGFMSDPSDGLLGLAFSSMNTGVNATLELSFSQQVDIPTVIPTPQKTFFDTAKSSLSSPLFTADLKYHAAGLYYLTFIDPSLMTCLY